MRKLLDKSTPQRLLADKHKITVLQVYMASNENIFHMNILAKYYYLDIFFSKVMLDGELYCLIQAKPPSKQERTPQDPATAQRCAEKQFGTESCTTCSVGPARSM